jgi:hypothetical protein
MFIQIKDEWNTLILVFAHNIWLLFYFFNSKDWHFLHYIYIYIYPFFYSKTVYNKGVLLTLPTYPKKIVSWSLMKFFACYYILNPRIYQKQYNCTTWVKTLKDFSFRCLGWVICGMGAAGGIHWMPIIIQLWMNLNWINIRFHLGNQFCRKQVSYIGK